MNEAVQQLIDLQNKYMKLAFDNWLSAEILTWSWWILVIMIVLPWVLFYRLFDRKRALSIWCFGLMVFIITTFTDDLGSELGVWIYPIKFVPVGLLAYPFDFSIIPVAYMLLFQYFTSWRTFLIALTCMSTVFAFIGEPVAVWIETVYYLKWKYTYSFVYYMVTGIMVKALTQKLIRANHSISSSG